VSGCVLHSSDTLVESLLNYLNGGKFFSRRGAIISTRQALPTAIAVLLVVIWMDL